MCVGPVISTVSGMEVPMLNIYFCKLFVTFGLAVVLQDRLYLSPFLFYLAKGHYFVYISFRNII